MLDFELCYTGPIHFLERFQRIYNLDQIKKDREALALDQVAKGFCKSMLRSRAYLSLKPSQIAAAALILAINVSTSELAGKIGLRKMYDLNLKSLFLENGNFGKLDSSAKENGRPSSSSKSKKYVCPLQIWNMVVRKTTELTIAGDLRPAYYQMCAILNEFEFNGLLSDYPDLFPPLPTPSSGATTTSSATTNQNQWTRLLHLSEMFHNHGPLSKECPFK